MSKQTEKLAAKLSKEYVMGQPIIVQPEDARTWAKALDQLSDLETSRHKSRIHVAIEVAKITRRQEISQVWDVGMKRVFLVAWSVAFTMQGLDLFISWWP